MMERQMNTSILCTAEQVLPRVADDTVTQPGRADDACTLPRQKKIAYAVLAPNLESSLHAVLLNAPWSCLPETGANKITLDATPVCEEEATFVDLRSLSLEQLRESGATGNHCQRGFIAEGDCWWKHLSGWEEGFANRRIPAYTGCAREGSASWDFGRFLESPLEQKSSKLERVSLVDGEYRSCGIFDKTLDFVASASLGDNWPETRWLVQVPDRETTGYMEAFRPETLEVLGAKGWEATGIPKGRNTLDDKLKGIGGVSKPSGQEIMLLQESCGRGTTCYTDTKRNETANIVGVNGSHAVETRETTELESVRSQVCETTHLVDARRTVTLDSFIADRQDCDNVAGGAHCYSQKSQEYDNKPMKSTCGVLHGKDIVILEPASQGVVEDFTSRVSRDKRDNASTSASKANSRSQSLNIPNPAQSQRNSTSSTVSESVVSDLACCTHDVKYTRGYVEDTQDAADDPITENEIRRFSADVGVPKTNTDLKLLRCESSEDHNGGQGILSEKSSGNLHRVDCGSTAASTRSRFGSQDSKSRAMEVEHVHQAYSQIAPQCQHVKQRAWPKVRNFLRDLDPGSLVADVGCGNGRYLNVNPSVWKFGSDTCRPFLQQARVQGHEVMLADTLVLPYRDATFDGAISIGVIHHLASKRRRVTALNELARVLALGGRVMIYVWALEQTHRKFDCQDVLIPWVKPDSTGGTRRNVIPRLSETVNTSTDSERSSVSKEATSVDGTGIPEHVSLRRADSAKCGSSVGSNNTARTRRHSQSPCSEGKKVTGKFGVFDKREGNRENSRSPSPANDSDDTDGGLASEDAVFEDIGVELPTSRGQGQCETPSKTRWSNQLVSECRKLGKFLRSLSGKFEHQEIVDKDIDSKGMATVRASGVEHALETSPPHDRPCSEAGQLTLGDMGQRRTTGEMDTNDACSLVHGEEISRGYFADKGALYSDLTIMSTDNTDSEELNGTSEFSDTFLKDRFQQDNTRDRQFQGTHPLVSSPNTGVSKSKFPEVYPETEYSNDFFPFQFAGSNSTAQSHNTSSCAPDTHLDISSFASSSTSPSTSSSSVSDDTRKQMSDLESLSSKQPSEVILHPGTIFSTSSPNTMISSEDGNEIRRSSTSSMESTEDINGEDSTSTELQETLHNISKEVDDDIPASYRYESENINKQCGNVGQNMRHSSQFVGSVPYGEAPALEMPASAQNNPPNIQDSFKHLLDKIAAVFHGRRSNIAGQKDDQFEAPSLSTTSHSDSSGNETTTYSSTISTDSSYHLSSAHFTYDKDGTTNINSGDDILDEEQFHSFDDDDTPPDNPRPDREVTSSAYNIHRIGQANRRPAGSFVDDVGRKKKKARGRTSKSHMYRMDNLSPTQRKSESFIRSWSKKLSGFVSRKKDLPKKENQNTQTAASPSVEDIESLSISLTNIHNRPAGVERKAQQNRPSSLDFSKKRKRGRCQQVARSQPPATVQTTPDLSLADAMTLLGDGIVVESFINKLDPNARAVFEEMKRLNFAIRKFPMSSLDEAQSHTENIVSNTKLCSLNTKPQVKVFDSAFRAEHENSPSTQHLSESAASSCDIQSKISRGLIQPQKDTAESSSIAVDQPTIETQPHSTNSASNPLMPPEYALRMYPAESLEIEGSESKIFTNGQPSVSQSQSSMPLDDTTRCGNQSNNAHLPIQALNAPRDCLGGCGTTCLSHIQTHSKSEALQGEGVIYSETAAVLDRCVNGKGHEDNFCLEEANGGEAVDCRPACSADVDEERLERDKLHLQNVTKQPMRSLDEEVRPCQGQEPERARESKQSRSSETEHTDESDSDSNTRLSRYYHVFTKGELDDLIKEHVPSLKVVDTFYDHANWCVVAEKQ